MEITIKTDGYENRFECPTENGRAKEPDYASIMKDFRDRGVAVTQEALEHNFNAWASDYKSGYRDEENGYFLFTPCGCNNLRFDFSTLEPGLDWQKTYEA